MCLRHWAGALSVHVFRAGWCSGARAVSSQVLGAFFRKGHPAWMWCPVEGFLGLGSGASSRVSVYQHLLGHGACSVLKAYEA